MFNFKNFNHKKFDFKLFILTVILCAFGLLMLYSSTRSLGPKGARIVKTQFIATILGFILLIFLTFFDYRIFGEAYLYIYGLCNALLVLVLIFGTGEDQWGARSWLKIGPVMFQPSEFVKVGLIVSLAKYIDLNKYTLNEPKTLLKVLAFALFPVALIMGQPDAGTAMVFVFFIALMLFVAGLDWRYIIYALILGIVSLPFLWFRLDVYQKNRFYNFINPEWDMKNTGYQAAQGKVAIGSGKFFGRGFLKGPQAQNNFISQKQDDFIFAVIGEELGFLGGTFLIVLYFLFLKRLIDLARDNDDMFGSLIIVGFAASMIFHIFENIGMTIGVMPITGIPLPFISHGGTFQLANLIFVGIILSISLHRENLSFE